MTRLGELAPSGSSVHFFDFQAWVAWKWAGKGVRVVGGVRRQLSFAPGCEVEDRPGFFEYRKDLNFSPILHHSDLNLAGVKMKSRLRTEDGSCFQGFGCRICVVTGGRL
jgi:hypothetical protein